MEGRGALLLSNQAEGQVVESLGGGEVVPTGLDELGGRMDHDMEFVRYSAPGGSRSQVVGDAHGFVREARWDDLGGTP